MAGESQFDFKNFELDEDLLQIPFGIQTNWHVITGAPSCGKTTLINLFAERGFQTAREGARLFLDREIARGHTIEEIRSNVVDLQRNLKDMQLEIERELNPKEFIFLDRALPDYLAWYRVFGMNPNEFLHECFYFRYASVFTLDPLPIEFDGLRFKDTALQNFTNEWHMRDYNALGYSTMSVPIMSPDDRLAFVLRVLTKQGWLQ